MDKISQLASKNSIGIDVERIKRFRISRNSSFIKNNYTKKEINYAFSKKKPEITLCGLFCAKEAIIKTLDNQSVMLKQIEIKRRNGRPYAKIGREEGKYSLSISHSGDYSVAVALKL